MNFEEYKALSLKQQDIPAMQKQVLLPVVQEARYNRERFIFRHFSK